MYVVTGSTGNTGNIVARELLKQGKTVKVVSRNAAHLKDLEDLGAIAAVGDLSDSAFVTELLDGANGAYLMIPPRFDAADFRAYQKSIAENFARALRKHQVPQVVTLSSYGAHVVDGLGVVSGLYPMEDKLNTIDGISVRHIRAGYFYENFFASIPVIKQQGFLGGFPIKGDVPLHMVHTSDIGETAANLLSDPSWRDRKAIFLSYKQPYTLQQAATILGKAIGKDLDYVAFPSEGAREAMIGMGMSESLADNYVEFSEGTNAGSLSEENGLHEKINSPTSLHDFAKEFAAAYEI